MSMSIDTIDDLPTLPLGARSLLLTMLGEFVYPAGGSVWTSTIVGGLATVGITERNARQAVARLGEQGVVDAERHGRRTQWHLTDRGTQLLATGTERIYSFGRRADDWDGTWLLVICSIPETQRAVRHQFRTRLTFEGFGFLSPTIAVSPHPEREKAANDLISELGLDDTAVTFLSTSGSMTSDADVLAAAWDLDALERSYESFVAEFDAGVRDGLADRVRDGVRDRRAEPAPAEAFGDMLRLVDTWRRFPFLDPELPSALLPTTWIGARAHEVFERRRTAERPAALAWFEETEATAGG
jgi:phenylacetic acid degradation operon negative regulatory protein